MTIHRAKTTISAPNGGRELSVSGALPGPSCALPGAGGRAVNGASPRRSSAAPPRGSRSVDAAPIEVAERYLAPALKSAAAARARTANIRAAAWATVAGPVQPCPSDKPAEPAAQAPAAPTPGPAPQPAPAHDLQIAQMAVAPQMRELTVTGSAASGGLPAILPTGDVPGNRGLTVAEAARASRIPFRPLERPTLLLTAPLATPENEVLPQGKQSAAASVPAAAPATRKPVAPARAIAPIRTPGAPAEMPAAPPAAAPAKAVTRPGGARLLPAEATRRAAPERAQRQQRFTKTIAELQRSQAATRPSEPWGNVVPRPAVPQSNPTPVESRWSRLWSRR